MSLTLASKLLPNAKLNVADMGQGDVALRRKILLAHMFLESDLTDPVTNLFEIYTHISHETHLLFAERLYF